MSLFVLSFLIFKNYKKESKEIIDSDNKAYIYLNKDNIIYNKNLGEDEIDHDLRYEIINHTISNFTELSPYPSNYNSEWNINRFAFVDNNNFYVEYSDDHDLARILVYCVESDKDLNCSRITYFTAIDFIWNIEEGSDPFAERDVQYYEKDENNNWDNTYKSTEIFYFPVSSNTLQEIQKGISSDINIWRLDVEDVTKRDLANVLKYDFGNIETRIKSETDDITIVEARYNDIINDVYLYQPVKQGDRGIWAIKYMKFMK